MTTGFGHVRVSLLADHTFALPQLLGNIDTSKVRWIHSMTSAAAALQRYEGVIRKEMAASSEIDRIFDIPDSQSASRRLLAKLFIERSRTLRGAPFGRSMVS